MSMNERLLSFVILLSLVTVAGGADRESIEDAWRCASVTRTRISLNGLWNAGPSKDRIDYCGKIPGVWKLGSDVFNTRGQDWRLPSGKNVDLKVKDPTEIWYERTFSMPKEIQGKRVLVTFTMVNSAAEVYVDDELAGRVDFPSGEVDVTDRVIPGESHKLTLHVTAYPRNATTSDYMAPDRKFTGKSTVRLRGITGDLYLDIVPKGVRILRAKCRPDVVRKSIAFSAEFEGKVPSDARLVATVDGCGENGRRFTGDPKGFAVVWPEVRTWDLHTPTNVYSCRLSLVDASGKTLDETVPFKLGYRDFRCDGRDFKMNGSTVHLRVLHNTSINAGAHLCCKESAAEFCRRLKVDGYNAIILGNYGFAAGSVAYTDGLLEACDEAGVLVAWSLPHARDYSERMEDVKVQHEYREAVRRLIDLSCHHPCVVLYALNHNYAGYCGDMNPARMDGKYALSDACTDSCMTRRRRAAICEKLVREVDDSLPIYHHESGNMGDLHTSNIYLNWAPVQERSDWLEHWEREGVKPIFFVEWGNPHTPTWSSYRGPEFIWRSRGYQSCWAEEYAATLLGPAAYEASEMTAKALAAEDAQWKQNSEFSFGTFIGLLREWDSSYYAVLTRYVDDNLRSLRAAGLSAMLLWDQETFWRRKLEWVSQENPKALENLKHPGIVPDFRASQGQYWIDHDVRSGVFERTPLGAAINRWNHEDLMFIGGAPARTDKLHNVRPGGAVEKCLVIVNDRRTPVSVSYRWRLLDAGGRNSASQDGNAEVVPGGRVEVPMTMSMPSEGGWATLIAEVTYPEGKKIEDRFKFNLVPESKIDGAAFELIDGKGDTAKTLGRLGIAAGGAADAVVVGRGALTRELFEGRLVPLARSGGRVLVFEQDKKTLESIGFRVQEYGLRTVFPRAWDPIISVFAPELLQNWAGCSTLLTVYREDLAQDEVAYPSTTWAGFVNTRVWRAGNRAAVATVLPEKPSCGNWISYYDGGFALQYAPLLEWRLGAGSITFCQLDVTERTMADPIADDLVRRLVSRLSRKVERGIVPTALGNRAFVELQRYGVPCERPRSQTFVVSSGAVKPSDFDARVANGATALLLGLTADELKSWCAEPILVGPRTGIAYERMSRAGNELAGVSVADWAWHGLMDFDALQDKSDDATAAYRVIRHGKGRYIIWQMPPWKIDYGERPQLRVSFRGASRMLERLFGNLGIRSELTSVRYADDPVAEDDPYRFYRW